MASNSRNLKKLICKSKCVHMYVCVCSLCALQSVETNNFKVFFFFFPMMFFGHEMFMATQYNEIIAASVKKKNTEKSAKPNSCKNIWKMFSIRHSFHSRILKRKNKTKRTANSSEHRLKATFLSLFLFPLRNENNAYYYKKSRKKIFDCFDFVAH